MKNIMAVSVLDEIRDYTHTDDFMDASYSVIDENTSFSDLDFSKVRGNVKVMQGKVLLLSEMNDTIRKAKAVTFP
jgi:hypothetical protein